MKITSISILLLTYGSSFSQVTSIITGTSEHLTNISFIQNSLLISGYKEYLVKSYDECKTVIPLNTSDFASNNLWFNLHRIDTSVIYATGISSNLRYTIWKSIDGGYNWAKKYDTISGHTLDPVITRFFDPQNGISICYNFKTLKTSSGFDSYTIGSWNNKYPQCAAVCGDSTIIIGDNQGGGYISKDRGNSWQGTSGINIPPFDFVFLNKDTVFTIGNYNTMNGYLSCFQSSFDGGNNWGPCIGFPESAVSYTLPDYNLVRLFAKKSNEIYILARDGGTNLSYIGYGVILKTTDLGQTWSSFITPFKENINDMKFLNDSVALICGNNGLLFKWNSKRAVFTKLKESEAAYSKVKFFPNPVKDKLQISFEKQLGEDLELKISNTLGQNVLFRRAISAKEEIDIDFLEPGIYYLTLSQEGGRQRVFKVVKE